MRSAIARRTMTPGIPTKSTTHHHVGPSRVSSAWLSATHPYVADGGLETDPMFNHGVELRNRAAYLLLRSERGLALLDDYDDGSAAIARRHGTGLLLETPTRHASADWGSRFGDGRPALRDVNVLAAALAAAARVVRLPARGAHQGAIGPCPDTISAGGSIDPDLAQTCHEPQVDVLAEGGVDLVDDETCTVHYMMDCAHPLPMTAALEDGAWRARVVGVRCNASTKTHAEIDSDTRLAPGTSRSSAGATPSCARCCRASWWSAAAAAPTAATSRRSGSIARPPGCEDRPVPPRAPPWPVA